MVLSASAIRLGTISPALVIRKASNATSRSVEVPARLKANRPALAGSTLSVVALEEPPHGAVGRVVALVRVARLGEPQPDRAGSTRRCAHPRARDLSACCRAVLLARSSTTRSLLMAMRRPSPAPSRASRSSGRRRTRARRLLVVLRQRAGEDEDLGLVVQSPLTSCRTRLRAVLALPCRSPAWDVSTSEPPVTRRRVVGPHDLPLRTERVAGEVVAAAQCGVDVDGVDRCSRVVGHRDLGRARARRGLLDRDLWRPGRSGVASTTGICSAPASTSALLAELASASARQRLAVDVE